MLNVHLLKIVVGCLRSTIARHGPITAELITSAAKRIAVQLETMQTASQKELELIHAQDPGLVSRAALLNELKQLRVVLGVNGRNLTALRQQKRCHVTALARCYELAKDPTTPLSVIEQIAGEALRQGTSLAATSSESEDA